MVERLATARLGGTSRHRSPRWNVSPPLASDAELQGSVERVFAENRGTYGSPRIREQLQREGIRTSKRRVERAMRSLGLVARQHRRYVRTTLADGSHPVAPNALDRNFSATTPNKRWVTDISYVWTDEGWAYLAVILDLYSRAVVGWALGDSLSTQLPLAALDAAVRRRRPERGLLSDRG